MKPEVLAQTINLCEINVLDKVNLIDPKNITLRTSVREAIRQCRTKLTDRQIFDFRKDIGEIYQSFCRKIVTRSPLKFSLTKAISCFDPKIAIKDHLRKERFSNAIDYFVSHNWITSLKSDAIEDQFETICLHESFADSATKFSTKDKRLDDFWIEKLQPLENFKDLHDYIKMVFLLSQGQAFAERGFSINIRSV